MWNFLKIIPPKLAQTSKTFNHICEAFFSCWQDILELIQVVIISSIPIIGSPFFDQIAKDRGIK
ncbi:MAG: hypothetical protein ACRCTJ_03445, partial [Brevinema sp.]